MEGSSPGATRYPKVKKTSMPIVLSGGWCHGWYQPIEASSASSSTAVTPWQVRAMMCSASMMSWISVVWKMAADTKRSGKPMSLPSAIEALSSEYCCGEGE